MKEVLRVEQLTHVYGPGTPFEKTAVDKVDFSARHGEFLALIGHTGSGKSTLIQHFNGLLRPTSGRVLINGEDIYQTKEMTRAARFAVGLVFQYPEYQLFEETVYADVAFGPKNMGLEKAEIDRRVRENCRITGMAGLDPAGCEDVFRFIREYHQKHGTTIIFVTHSMEYAALLAQRIVVMDHGRILMDGTPQQIFSRSEELLRAGLDVPQVTRVFLELKKRGVPVDPAVYTVSQAAEALRRLKGGERPC